MDTDFSICRADTGMAIKTAVFIRDSQRILHHIPGNDIHHYRDHQPQSQPGLNIATYTFVTVSMIRISIVMIPP